MLKKVSSPLGCRKALTLIELILVIAIAAILVAMIFPIARNLIFESQTSRCVSQLRQIGQALTLYQGDNQGQFPPAVGGYYPEIAWKGVWFNPVTSSTPNELGLAGYTGGTKQLFSISVCPLNLHKTNLPSSPNPLGFPYVVNYFVMPSLPKPICRIAQLPQPSKIAVMMDSLTGPLWGYGVTGNLDAQGAYRIQESHAGRANVLWADGHVSSTRKSDLKYYNFNHEEHIP